MYKIQSLNGRWKLYQAEAAGAKTYLAETEVPGTVLDALCANGLIGDPYWRCNEYPAREWMAKDYVFEHEFEVEDSADLECDAVELVCEGLDTIAAIRVNGILAAYVDDMHRTYRIPVKGILRPGANTISICFSSALNAAREEDRKNDIFYASTGCIHGNAVLRKAHYMFGWDWGPQLPDAGIFRGISLEYTRGVRIGDFRIRQNHREDGSVELELSTALKAPGSVAQEAVGPGIVSSEARAPGSVASGRVMTEAAAPGNVTSEARASGSMISEAAASWSVASENVSPESGAPGSVDGELTLEIEISGPGGEGDCVVREMRPYGPNVRCEIHSPQLWWPNGLGEQPLYRVTVCLKDQNKETLDRVERRIGLRTITVCTDRHEYGEEFAFAVNGVKLFAMGANYVPEDNFLTRVSRERTEKLIKDCRRANFNCIRVWGGGYYPDDFFYDACDEAGILVWQDLMFACNVYAWNEHFEENIVAETMDNVRRLRHHACLALWCGNNEMEWGWGEGWARIRGHHPRYKADYIKIFEYILPKALKNCDDVTFFWPSSPSSGGAFDDPNAVNRGDQHYWEVWHSGKPFTEYRKNYFSFCSEYGFQSFPCGKTIRSFTLPEDRNIFSEVMESHQKNGAANGKILNYVADYFLYPKDLYSLAYISQVLQLKAIQYGVEHWRRNRGRCMGSLYWQLNDCWPVASWASMDYYGRWKALHYGVRRFYAPVMVSACEKEELSTQISYFVHNDTLNPFDGRLEIALIGTDLQVLWEDARKVYVDAMTAACQMETDFEAWIPRGRERCAVFARARLYAGEEIISQRVTLFVKPKHFHYPKAEYEIHVEEMDACYQIRVSSPGFAQYVELELEEADVTFSDNYFDLTEPDGRVICLPKDGLAEPVSRGLLESGLKLRSVADSYEIG